MPDLLQIAEESPRAGDEVGVWSAVNALPPVEHSEPTVVDLKVGAVTAFGRFDRSEARQWADLLAFADDAEAHRATLDEFVWRRAAWLLEKGRVE